MTVLQPAETLASRVTSPLGVEDFREKSFMLMTSQSPITFRVPFVTGVRNLRNPPDLLATGRNLSDGASIADSTGIPSAIGIFQSSGIVPKSSDSSDSSDSLAMQNVLRSLRSLACGPAQFGTQKEREVAVWSHRIADSRTLHGFE